MCRSLKVLCAAPGRDRLSALKRAAVAADWELVGGATTLEELEEHIERWEPDVVVVDAGLGPDACLRAAARAPRARIVTLGPGPGAHAEAASLEDVRPAILGVPRPEGPVRG